MRKFLKYFFNILPRSMKSMDHWSEREIEAFAKKLAKEEIELRVKGILYGL